MSGSPHADLAVALAIAALMGTAWIVSVVRRDSSVVDPIWGPGFVLTGWVAWLASPATGARPLIVLGLTTVWGLRLGVHLLARNLREGEDRRYRRMREAAGTGWAWKSLFVVFGLQGALMWLIAWPIRAATTATSETPLGLLDLIAGALWTLGFAFEAVGDAQLRAFKADPRSAGAVLDRGLWAWTRHPNYFGDACLWWGLGLFAFAGEGGPAVFIGPTLMTLLLLRVSGVRLLERDLRYRKAGYEEYQRRVPAFFPRPPRRIPSNFPQG